MKRKIYETPVAEVMEFVAEGVFCNSVVESSEMEEWGEEDFVWDME